MHQLGKLTKNVVVLDSCNDNKKAFYSILLCFYFMATNKKQQCYPLCFI